MSTKTIALDLRVYQKLARLKRESESFSRVIDRLVEQSATTHTGADILARVAAFPALSQADARTMKQVIEDNRRGENWESHDLP